MIIEIELRGSREDIALQLEHVIEKLREGYWYGAGWDLSEKDPEAEEPEQD